MVERVDWRQVWGLATFVGATTFCWLAYGFYQPLILNQLGFTELANTLTIAQGLLGASQLYSGTLRLSTGLYFGGMGLATAIVSILLLKTI